MVAPVPNGKPVANGCLCHPPRLGDTLFFLCDGFLSFFSVSICFFLAGASFGSGSQQAPQQEAPKETEEGMPAEGHQFFKLHCAVLSAGQFQSQGPPRPEEEGWAER